MPRVGVIVFCFVLAIAEAAGAQDSRFWVVWERQFASLDGCADTQTCPPALYSMHMIQNIAPHAARTFYQNLEPAARATGVANLRLEASPICAALPGQAETKDNVYEERIIADKIDTLRGLAGVYVDARGVRGPAEFEGGFGRLAQGFIEETFARHDIPLLERDARVRTPGAPILTMRFSKEVYGCKPWSISLSLKQDVVLARDSDVMIEATTWSTWVQATELDADFDVRQGMEQAVVTFANAWSEANDPNWSPPAEE
ncbi:MAG: hypothetical protein ACU0CI_07540 [Shimia sp.]